MIFFLSLNLWTNKAMIFVEYVGVFVDDCFLAQVTPYKIKTLASNI